MAEPSKKRKGSSSTALEDGAPFERHTNVQPDGSFEQRDLPAGHGVVQVLRFVKGAAVEDEWELLAEMPCVLVAGETTTIEILVAP